MDIVEKLVTTTEAMANLCSAPMDLWNEHSNAALMVAAELTTLRKRVEELEGALEPFAVLGDVVLGEAPANATRFDAFQDCRGVTHKLELDDFRRARAALRAKGGDNGE